MKGGRKQGNGGEEERKEGEGGGKVGESEKNVESRHSSRPILGRINPSEEGEGGKRRGRPREARKTAEGKED
jgi:hypothetical protein